MLLTSRFLFFDGSLSFLIYFLTDILILQFTVVLNIYSDENQHICKRTVFVCTTEVVKCLYIIVSMPKFEIRKAISTACQHG
jgi:hypothetical protein